MQPLIQSSTGRVSIVEVANSHNQKLSQLLRDNYLDWWRDTLTVHKTELLEKIRELLNDTKNGPDGYLEGAIKTPKRISLAR